MAEYDYLASFTRFCGFKVLVRANRLGCDNDLARLAHDRLLAKLNELVELMRNGMAAERGTMLPEGSARFQEACEDLYWIEAEFDRWLSPEPYALLDRLIIDTATKEIYDEQLQRWRFLDDDGPWLHDVSDAELCGLRRIIDQIAAETGVRFSACRIAYEPVEAAR